jgi:integrase
VAYIREYKSKKNSRLYSARWKLANGKEGEARGFKTRKEAKNHAEEMEAFERKVRKNQAKRVAGPTTLRDFIQDVYVSSLETERSTKENYERIINAHILPKFGSYPLRNIKPADIKEWRNELRAKKNQYGLPLNENYVEKIAIHLGMILNTAVDNDYLESSPMRKVKKRKGKVKKKKVIPLNMDQVSKIAENMSPQYRLIVWLGFYTGMRPSEALGLTIDRIDFEKKTIRIDRQISRYQNEVFADFLKTPASDRTIHLMAPLGVLIQEHISKFGLGPHGLLLKNKYGGIWRYRDAAHRFRIAARPVGVPTGEGLHLLRHTCVSNLIRFGFREKQIQEWVGHESIQETYDTYGHLFPDYLSSIGEEIDDKFANLKRSDGSELFVVA